MAISRRTFSLATAFIPVAAMLGTGALTAVAQPWASRIADVEAYINGIDTLEADFSQIGPDGVLTTGKFYLDRPGRMRIDYDPPSKILLIARDWRLIYYDGSIKQVTTIPLSQTPLSILLDEHVELAGDVSVMDVVEQNDTFEMTMVRSDAADQGSVTLRLDKEPVRLLSWVVIDPQGYRTELMLQNVKLGGTHDRHLFRWRNPKIFGWPEED